MPVAHSRLRWKIREARVEGSSRLAQGTVKTQAALEEVIRAVLA